MTTTLQKPPGKAPSVQLPRFAWYAMSRFSPAEQAAITSFEDYLELVIGFFAGGRIKESSLAYYLYGGRGWIGEELTAMVTDTVNAWWAHIGAETGQYDIHALEPEWQDEEVYAERCRADLDEELAGLAKAVLAVGR